MIYNMWGKTDPNNKSNYHELIYHMIDVGNVARAWINSEPNLKSLLLKYVDEKTLNIIPFLCSLHDLGKASTSFQYKLPIGNKINAPADKKILDMINDGNEINAYHNIFTAYSIAELSRYETLFLYDNHKSFRGIVDVLGSHHGHTLKSKDLYDDRYEIEFETLYRNIHIKLITKLAKLFQIKLPVSIDSIFQKTHFLNLFIGILVISDWIASNADYFNPVNGIDVDQYFNTSAKNALNAIEKTKILYSVQFKSDVEYSNAIGFDRLRKIQEYAIHPKNTGLTIIEASTGEGKTETAQIILKKLIDNKIISGFAIGMPTRMTSNSMYDRTKRFLQNIISDNDINLILSHSTSWAYDNFIKFYENNDGMINKNEWLLSTKRSLLSQFVVCTIDQLLMSSIAVRHYWTRMLGVCRKAVVLDEVHSFDPFTTSLIDNFLEFCGIYEIPVIMLSATLSTSKKEQFVNSYLKHSKNSHVRYMANEDYEEFKSQKTDSFPCITHTYNRRGYEKTQIDSHKEKRIDYIIEGCYKNNFSLLYNRVMDKISDGGVIGIYANTIDMCQNIGNYFNARISGIDLVILNSRMLLSQRMNIEQKLEKCLNKNSKRPDAMVVVGTQILQQSLDIDFDYTENFIKPIDSLVQEWGRNHRFSLNRPSKMKNPESTVLIPMPDDIGHNVYDRHLVGQTLHLLEQNNCFVTPTDNKRFIDTVYDSVDFSDFNHHWYGSVSEKEQRKWKKEYENKTSNYLRHANRISNILDKNTRLCPTITHQELLEIKDRDRVDLGDVGTRIGYDVVLCVLARESNYKYLTLWDEDRVYWNQLENENILNKIYNNSFPMYGYFVDLLESEFDTTSYFHFNKNKFLSNFNVLVIKNGNSISNTACHLEFDDLVGISIQRINF